MDDNFYLSIHPGGFDLDHLPDDPQSVSIHKASGETITLDPGQARLEISADHPEVERMEGDWGAICEVFRKSNYYYTAVSGVSLSIGDSITVRYKNRPDTVRLKVIDIENGRARIDPPEISAGGGVDGDRQNP